MLKDLLRKRVLAAVAGVVTTLLTSVFQDNLGLDPAEAARVVDTIMGIVMTYIVGQSATDAIAIHKGTKTN